LLRFAQDDDGNARQVFRDPDAAQHLEPVERSHVEVEQDQVRQRVPAALVETAAPEEIIESLEPAAGDARLVADAVPANRLQRAVKLLVVVVDHHDAGSPGDRIHAALLLCSAYLHCPDPGRQRPLWGLKRSKTGGFPRCFTSPEAAELQDRCRQSYFP
jgi:hypothetical protein